jgi:hypothetical protein
MTILESGLTAINTTSQLLTNNASTNESVNIAEQTISGLTSFGESFATIFSGVQQANETVLDQVPSSVTSAIDGINNVQQGVFGLTNLSGIASFNAATQLTSQSSIEAMQQSIFSSLGLGGLSNEVGLSTLESLTSESSIDFMQSSLLSALQTSIFSPQTTTNLDTTATVDSAVIDNAKISKSDAEVTGDIINNLSQMSFGDDGLDVKDAFDIVNVLQHIPVVSTVYQDVMGEDISAVSKLSGGYLYGGAFGLAFSALDLAIESYSGSSVNKMLTNFDYTSLFDNEEVIKSPMTARILSQK